VLSVRAYAAGATSPEYQLAVPRPVRSIAVGTINGQVEVFVPAYGVNAPIYVFSENGSQPLTQI
jgi:hypothetical protein